MTFFRLSILFLHLIYLGYGCMQAKRDYPHSNILEWDKGRKKEIQTMLRRDTSFNLLNRYIIHTATLYIQTQPLKRKLRGIRLLDTSQEILKRSLYLSYTYHITGEEKYAERAKQEILNACSYSDWNPRHFLDVAEMSLAVSIGYSWLKDKFTRDERDSVIQALLRNAIQPAEKLLPSKGFYSVSTNWNPVCNAGIVAAAISIFSYYPEESEKIIRAAEESNGRYIETFQPNGASPEGYGYWGYGMNFECILLDLLESFREKRTNSKTLSILERSVYFVQCLSTPTLRCYNYSDNGDLIVSNLASWWLATKIGNTIPLIDRSLISYGIPRIGSNRILPIFLTFVSRLTDTHKMESPSKLNFFMGRSPILTYREDYADVNSVYLGIKGGSASIPHAHMDAGSMIYENKGIRWIVELGQPDYYKREAEGYDLWNMSQNSTRWKVPEISPEWHSTIQLDETQHKVDRKAEIISVIDSKEKCGGIIDMTNILGDIQQAHRGIFVDADRNLIIQDSICNDLNSHKLDWHIITEATPTIVTSDCIYLEQDGKKGLLKFKSDHKLPLYIITLKYQRNNSSLEKTFYKIGFTDTLIKKEKYIIEAKLNILD